MIENINTLQNIQDELSKDYYFDMFVVNYHVVNDRSNIDKKIQDTITLYCEYHPDFDIEFFNKFPEHFLKKIVKKDTVICFENILILRELYNGLM